MWHLPAHRTTRAAAWVCLFVAALTPSSAALADAGAVRASERHGDRQITVFTDPTPLRAGLVDVSVLVLDAVSGEAILDDTIHIAVAPRGLSSMAERHRASSAAASNKLFQAANFELPRAGWWEFTIETQSPQDMARMRFELEAGEPLPRWQALWPWFCWPFFIIAVFAVLQVRRYSTMR